MCLEKMTVEQLRMGEVASKMYNCYCNYLLYKQVNVSRTEVFKYAWVQTGKNAKFIENIFTSSCGFQNIFLFAKERKAEAVISANWTRRRL